MGKSSCENDNKKIVRAFGAISIIYRFLKCDNKEFVVIGYVNRFSIVVA